MKGRRRFKEKDKKKKKVQRKGWKEEGEARRNWWKEEGEEGLGKQMKGRRKEWENKDGSNRWREKLLENISLSDSF